MVLTTLRRHVRPRRGTSWAAALVLAMAVSCVDDLDEKDRPCPCAAGWYCDRSGSTKGRCIEGAPPADLGAEADAVDSAAAPDLTTDGTPPLSCSFMIAGFIDRFDDGLLNGWTVKDGTVKLSGQRLLAIRTADRKKGLAVHPVSPRGGPWSVTAQVELVKDQSWAALSMGKESTMKAYHVVLTSDTYQGKVAGLFLTTSTYSKLTSSTPTLVAKTFSPRAGQKYQVRLDRSAGGVFTLHLDGKQVGQATDTGLTTFDMLELKGGQDADAGHGAYFDDVVVHSCAGDVPEFVQVGTKAVWKGGNSPSEMIKAAPGYRLYHAATSIHLDTSVDGKTWKTLAQDVITQKHTQEKYNINAAVRKDTSGYRAWISASSDGCLAFTQIYLATSSDGQTWNTATKVYSNSAAGGFDSRNINAPDVVYDGKQYHLYYSSVATSGGDQCTSGTHKWRTGIGYATSPDGIKWTRRGVVIPRGLAKEADSTEIDYPRVFVTAKGFEIFYTAMDAGSKQRIMYATSSDGSVWTKRGALTLDMARVVARFGSGPSTELFYLCGGGVCLARPR